MLDEAIIIAPRSRTLEMEHPELVLGRGLPKLEYIPLDKPDSIRLLILHPGLPGSIIRCSLIHTTVTNCFIDIYDHYTALSYAWGDAHLTKNVLIDDQPFQATLSLSAALNDLRDTNRPLRMWVDAICINQGDIEERNTQIGLMRDIYSLAQRTVIYLGDPVDLFSQIIIDGDGSTEAIKAAWSVVHTRGESQAMAAEILSRPWFTRVWVYQELVLSREVWVQCGRLRMHWETVLDLFTVLNGKEDQNMHLDRIFSMHQTREKFWLSRGNVEKFQSLASVLSYRKGMGASNPRDMIYGHLAVVASNGPNQITVDYAKSVAEVFTEAAALMFHGLEKFDFLREIEVRRGFRRIDGLPSWVPDWTLGPSSLLTPMPKIADKRNLFRSHSLSEGRCRSFPSLAVIAFSRVLETGRVYRVSSVLPSTHEMWKFELSVYDQVIRDFGPLPEKLSLEHKSDRAAASRIIGAIHGAWANELSGVLPPLPNCVDDLRRDHEDKPGEDNPGRSESCEDESDFDDWRGVTRLMKPMMDIVSRYSTIEEACNDNDLLIKQFLDHKNKSRLSKGLLEDRRLAELLSFDIPSNQIYAIVPSSTLPHDRTFGLWDVSKMRGSKYHYGTCLRYDIVFRDHNPETAPQVTEQITQECKGVKGVAHGIFVGCASILFGYYPLVYGSDSTLESMDTNVQEPQCIALY